MAESVSFELTGLEELQEDLAKVITNYPDESKTALRQMANNFAKDVKSNGEPNYEDILSSKQWKKDIDVRAAQGGVSIDITNTHPLHHLLENGHEKWFMGKHIGGWVPGKHYTEKTRQDWNSKGLVAEKLDEVVQKVFKKVGL